MLDYAELPVPSSVRDAVLALVRAPGPPGEQCLQTASLLGRPIEPRWLAEAMDLDESAVCALQDHAVAARLLGDDDGRWDFAHDLVRQTLVDSQPLRRRRPWQRRLVASLERHGAGVQLNASWPWRGGSPIGTS